MRNISLVEGETGWIGVEVEGARVPGGDWQDYLGVIGKITCGDRQDYLR